MFSKHALQHDEPTERYALHFTAPDKLSQVIKPLGRNISALAISGRTLFCAADETSTIERLVYDPDENHFSGHTNFPLGNAIDLPGGPMGEMDIEGLAVAGGYLWISGSHSLKRDSPSTIQPDISDLNDIDWDKNRGFLGRVPLADHGNGVYEPVASINSIKGGKSRRAAMMKMGKDGGKSMRRLLGCDPLLAPFMNVPCKENGFDIKGLAVIGDRILLGLRGPVVGSYAILVEIRLKTSKKGWLTPRKLKGGARYRLHAINLGGLGIRDLLLESDDLLILAGPTQNVEGIQRIFSVPASKIGGVIPRDALKIVKTLEILDGYDHAEGLATFKAHGKGRLLVSHDSPAPQRYDESQNRLMLDAFPLEDQGFDVVPT